MNNLFSFPLLSILLFGSGCAEQATVEPTQTTPTCPNERTLDVYKDREAVVIGVGSNFCLCVDPTDIARGSYALENYLVPASPLPVQYQVIGKRVLLSGRKKSCYGLVTDPSFRTSFGYKLEIEALEEDSKAPGQ